MPHSLNAREYLSVHAWRESIASHNHKILFDFFRCLRDAMFWKNLIIYFLIIEYTCLLTHYNMIIIAIHKYIMVIYVRFSLFFPKQTIYLHVIIFCLFLHLLSWGRNCPLSCSYNRLTSFWNIIYYIELSCVYHTYMRMLLLLLLAVCCCRCATLVAFSCNLFCSAYKYYYIR